MAEIYPGPDSIAPPDSQSQTETPVPDKDLPSYRYARALCETARSVAQTRTQSFKRNRDFMLGRDHWGKPGTTGAIVVDSWAFQGVVNWTFATIKTKASMVTGAKAESFVEPLDDQSTYMDRLLVKAAVDHESERLRFNEVKRDLYLTASWSGVGIGMYAHRPDKLTGSTKITLSPVKPEEFFIDPSSDRITDQACRFVVWEPELDMSTVREMWPSKAPYVKPSIRQVTGGFTYRPDSTDDNLVYGTAGEFVVDQTNMLRSRKARVSFVWIRDDTLIEDLHEVLIKKETMGAECVSCGAVYESDAVPGFSPDDACPTCGGDMEQAAIPAKYEQNRVIRRKYPYGRLIVYSGDALLYDGESPYELENVFPFFVYHHERVPGDFYGTNDVDLLESLQDAQDRTVCQGIDYVRLAVNSPICYPVQYKAFTDLGNGPSQRLPGPSVLPWLPFRLSPQGFDTNTWSGLLGVLEKQFLIVGGLGNAYGQTSSPPISATEAEIANARLSDRMKGHAIEMSTACTDALAIQWQMMKQFYDQPMGAMVSMPDSTVQLIQIEVQKLPPVNIRVVIDTDLSTKDKLLGQNLAGFAQSGGMDSPYADIILGKFGFSPAEVKEFMARRGLQQEIMPPGAGAPPMPEAPQPQPQGAF